MRFDSATRPDAGSTNPGPLMGSVDHNPNSLQIGVPASLGDIMSVTDVISEKRPFTTDFAASRHSNLLVSTQKLIE